MSLASLQRISLEDFSRQPEAVSTAESSAAAESELNSDTAPFVPL